MTGTAFTETATPQTLATQPDDIPAALKAIDRWGNWEWVRRQNSQGNWDWTKPPIDARTGRRAESNNPAHWGPYDVAIARSDKVGFNPEPDGGIFFIDLDKARNPESGEIEGWARSIIVDFGPRTYVEASPSGTGLKIIGRGHWTHTNHIKRIGTGKVEVFEGARYTTITGHHLVATEYDLGDCQDILDDLYVALWPEPETAGRPPVSQTSMTDQEIIDRARAVTNGAKFDRLYGDPDAASDYGGDESAADCALASLLVFWDPPHNQVERIFSGSVRGRRDKWTDRPDYRRRTIEAAFDHVTERYGPPGTGPFGANGTSANGRHTDDHADAGSADQTAARPDGPRLAIVQMSQVSPTAIDWIWYRWLAKGKLHLFGGLGGIGKGTITAEIAAQLSTGTGTLPDGTPAPLVKTLFLLSEDDPGDTLRPRLDLHGANVANIHHVRAVVYPDNAEGMLDLRRHLPMLEVAIKTHDIDFLVIDALSDFMAGTDRNSEGAVRDTLTPLGQMAARTGVAVLGVMHPGKGNTELKGFQRLLGASAFGNVARCVWLAAEVPDDDQGRKLLGVDKSNLAIKPPTLEWSRQEDAPIVWHGPSTHTIGDAFGASTAKPRDDAEGFLSELLTGGSVAASTVESLSRAAGLSWATVRRAADSLKVVKYRPPGAKNPAWLWRLPNGPAGRADDGLDIASTSPGSSDELLTPRDAQVSNSSSRPEAQRVAHDAETWATREITHANGKVLTNRDDEQVVRYAADDVLTRPRLDDLLTRESQGVSKSSKPSSAAPQPGCVDCGSPLNGGAKYRCPSCLAKAGVA